jgi:hypothetical protein
VPSALPDLPGPAAPTGTLVVACGALAKELRSVLGQLGDRRITVVYLPAPLHNRPELIPGRVDEVLSAHSGRYARMVVAYADCGTSGALDPVLERHGAVRLPGAHCYDLFAGAALFAAMSADEPGTFWLTDFLARHFDALVWAGLGMDRHPELRDMYFGNYTRVVLISQGSEPELLAFGRAAAARLGLAFEHRHVGMEPFAAALADALDAERGLDG